MTKAAIPLVDLRAQYRTLKSELDQAIAGSLDRCSFILGPDVEAFERDFAAYVERDWCVGCANGTDALTLALEALGVGPGDEVVTVAHTFIATAEAIVALGARPVFVDVRDDTMLMDTTLLERALGPKVKAIVPVHLYGQCVDIDPVLELARPRGIAVVEDAAQAHGARYRDRPAGALGDLATFSFYPGKNLGAYGDAGAVVGSDSDLGRRIRMARNHGRLGKYTHEFSARNSRMDGIQGAVLAVKLRSLNQWNQRRRELAALYDRLLADQPGIQRTTVAAGCTPVHHLYVVRVSQRDRIAKALAADGIETGVHYPVPLHLQPAYRGLGLAEGSLPVTESAARQVLSLPLYPELTEPQVRQVVDALRRALASG